MYNISYMIDKKSEIFFTVFLLLILFSVAITYYRYVILKDFVVLTDEEAFNESLLEE